MRPTIERVHLTVSGVTHALAPTEDPVVLKRAIVEAVRSGGDFVDAVLDGGQRLSFLITGIVPVVITVETMVLDGEAADRGSTSWRPDFDPAYQEQSPYDLI